MSGEISEKKLEANRENAKLGGVKTEEGKTVSKYNALKHGILCKEALLEGENENDLSDSREGILNQFKPVGEMEMFLCERIISGIWRLQRTLRAEKSNMEYQLNHRGVYLEVDLDFFSSSDSSTVEEIKNKQRQRLRTSSMVENDGIEKIIRYENSIERSIYKSLHELQRLQAMRNGEKVQTPVAVDFDITRE